MINEKIELSITYGEDTYYVTGNVVGKLSKDEDGTYIEYQYYDKLDVTKLDSMSNEMNVDISTLPQSIKDDIDKEGAKLIWSK